MKESFVYVKNKIYKIFMKIHIVVTLLLHFEFLNACVNVKNIKGKIKYYINKFIFEDLSY